MSTETLTPVEDRVQFRSGVRYAIYALLCAFFAFILLYRLDVYPNLGFDEGAYVNLAQTFAEEGVYAETSSEGYRFNGAALSVGPTVILPISLIFKLFGVSFANARIVTVLYGVLTLLAVYGLSRSLLNQRFALGVVILLVFSWGTVMPGLYRAVTGVGPGMFYVFAGLYVWLLPGQRGRLRLMIVGVLFGLASISKIQIALFLLPALLIALIVDMLWYRQYPWSFYVIPGIVAGILFFGWTYYAWFLLGSDVRSVDTDVETIRTMGNARYFAINLVQLKTNLFYLLEGERYGGFLLAGIFTAIVLGIRRTQDGMRWVILSILFIMSLCTYMVSGGDPSEGYITAIPLGMLASIFVAFALYSLTHGFQISLRIDLQQIVVERQFSQQTALSLVVMAFIAAGIILPIFRTLYNVTATGTGAAYRVTEYLDNHAEPDSIVETWERELLVLSDLTFHVPPQSILAQVQVDKTSDPDSSSQIYDFRDHVEPQFVVIGVFARWAGIYDDTLAGYVQVAFYDQYTIFERVGELRKE